MKTILRMIGLIDVNELEIKRKDNKSVVMDDTSTALFGDKLFFLKSGIQQKDNIFQEDNYQPLTMLDLSNAIDDERNEVE